MHQLLQSVIPLLFREAEEEVMCESSYEGKNMNQQHFSDITLAEEAVSKKLNPEIECLTNREEEVRGRGTAEACS